jgi:hypothetical protein
MSRAGDSMKNEQLKCKIHPNDNIKHKSCEKVDGQHLNIEK